MVTVMMVLVGGTRKEARLGGTKKRYVVEMQGRSGARVRGLERRMEEEETAEVERRRLMKEMGVFNTNSRSMT